MKLIKFAVIFLCLLAYFIIKYMIKESSMLHISTKTVERGGDITHITKAAGPSPVIILTYMRSGSSFTGNIIQDNKDVFYLFEPYRLLQSKVRQNKTFTYFNGTSKLYTNFLDAARDATDDIINCRFQNLPIWFFSDGFLEYSEKAKEIRSCKIKLKSITKDWIYRCARTMIDICLNSKYIAIKTIRVPAETVEPFLERYPRMRILHLLRDPRATLNSQRKFGKIHVKTLSQDATIFCNRVYQDIVIMEYMKKHHQGRVFTVLYEDLAKNHTTKAREIYKFLNMSFSKETEQFIRSITAANESCQQVLCTVSSNSSAVADRWRYKVDINFVNTIDKVCLPLYSKLGVRAIGNVEDLKDPKFQTYTLNNEFDMGDYRNS